MANPFTPHGMVMLAPRAAGSPPSATAGANVTSLTATRGDALGTSLRNSRTEVSDVFRGKMTLAALDFMILAAIGWYIYTHDIQGGG